MPPFVPETIALRIILPIFTRLKKPIAFKLHKGVELYKIDF